MSGWWARNTTGNPEQGGVLAFRLAPGGLDMKVIELAPPTLVSWEVVEGPPEWVGTEIRFDIHQEDDHAIVLFGHRRWAEPGEFMAHCSTKWATYLMSLKELLETGSGRPDPDDVKISNWHTRTIAPWLQVSHFLGLGERLGAVSGTQLDDRR